MKNGWHRVPIKTVYTGLFDGPHATPKPSDDGPVFLGIKNISEDGHLVLNEIRHIAEEDFAKWTRRVCPQHNDIVFTYEATLNLYALIPQGLKCCLGRRLALIRPNQAKVDPKFLYFYFFSEDWRKTVATKTVIGSTVDRIPLLEFPDFPINLPSLPTQRKIAGVLSAYDDLIENNTRRIAILEEMAQAIYREWFVNFRFPGHENVKLFNSPLGKIPEGWKALPLSDIADVNALSIKKGKEPDEINYVDIASVSTGTIDDIRLLPFSEAPGRARRIVRHGDLIWSTVRPNRKSYSLILNPLPNMIVSTGFAVISGTKAPFSYLYHTLTTDDFVGYLVNHATGSAYPAVNSGDFEKATILVPAQDVLAAFHEITEPMCLAQHCMTEKNKKLRASRDLLLPKLISGQLDVEELDIETGESLVEAEA